LKLTHEPILPLGVAPRIPSRHRKRCGSGGSNRECVPDRAIDQRGRAAGAAVARHRI